MPDFVALQRLNRATLSGLFEPLLLLEQAPENSLRLLYNALDDSGPRLRRCSLWIADDPEIGERVVVGAPRPGDTPIEDQITHRFGIGRFGRRQTIHLDALG